MFIPVYLKNRHIFCDTTHLQHFLGQLRQLSFGYVSLLEAFSARNPAPLKGLHATNEIEQHNTKTAV